MTEILVEARDVRMDYADPSGTVPVLRGVELRVRPGEFVGIMGPSGSGKSTLLLLLAGLRAPSSGTVTFQGVPWPRQLPKSADRRRLQVGFVFQEPFLVSHLSARENALVQAVDDTARSRIIPLAESLGITSVLDRFPDAMSAGQRQRAGILRALVNAPALVLADEPTAWLDARTGAEVIACLWRASRPAAIVVATHDPTILDAADRVLRLEEGRLREPAPG